MLLFMDKIKFSVALIILVSCVSMAFLQSAESYNNTQSPDAPILTDERFNEMVEKAEEYGGGFVVSYDTETGEILSIEQSARSKSREAGKMSVLESEYNSNKDTLPEDTVVIRDDTKISEAVNMASNQ
jgi:hypothetical protein